MTHEVFICMLIQVLSVLDLIFSSTREDYCMSFDALYDLN